MGRIRTIKPEFFRSRSLAQCSRDARLTFQGLWIEADDHGRGVADTRLIKGAVWPLDDDITPETVETHLQELESTRHLMLFHVSGERYYEVLAWEKHQAPAYRRGEAKYPSPPAGTSERDILHDSARPEVQESALIGKGREVDIETARNCTIPKDFTPDEILRTWATTRGIRSNIDLETEKFVNHFVAKGERKKDWRAAWRNWMINADEFSKTKSKSNYEGFVDSEPVALGASPMFPPGAEGERLRDEFYSGVSITLPGES